MSIIKQLQTLSVYAPPPVAALVFQNPDLTPEGTSRRFQAVTMFADFSGFTPLAEALAANGVQGAEELNAILNRVFESLITTIESHGGQVVCFDGDALSLIWPYQPKDMIPTIWRALQAAFAMQSTIAGFTIISTSRGDFDLQMKVGISAGEVLEVHAGGNQNRLEYVLAGQPMSRMSQAEKLAKAGEIVVDQTIWNLAHGLDYDRARQMIHLANGHLVSLPQSYLIGEQTAVPGFYRITHLWSQLPPQSLAIPDWSQLDSSAATQAAANLHNYIPAVIAKAFTNGQEEPRAQLKSMTVCFFRFNGIDYTNDPDAGLRLNRFLHDVQTILCYYEGNINKLNVGDKGSVLLILFGEPPFTAKDNETRGVASTLALRHIANQHKLNIQAGLAAGPLFMGPLGAKKRREYTVIGDVVNRAARLMQKAKQGQVLVDTSVHQKAGQNFVYQDLGKKRVKGRTKPLHIFQAVDEKEPDGQLSILRYVPDGQDIEPDNSRADFMSNTPSLSPQISASTNN